MTDQKKLIDGLVEDLLRVIHEYDDSLHMATVIGCLEFVKQQLIDEANEDDDADERNFCQRCGKPDMHTTGEHMTGEEDEEFQRLEREAKMRRRAEEDDDIQDYKKPWVGLTELERAEVTNLKWWDWEDSFDIEGFARAIEAKLKEKNT